MVNAVWHCHGINVLVVLLVFRGHDKLTTGLAFPFVASRIETEREERVGVTSAVDEFANN